MIIELVDDLTGEPIEEGQGETIVFGWRDQLLEIDLSAENVARFEEAIAPFVQAARLHLPAERPSRRKRRNYRQEQDRKQFLKGLREWAAHEEIPVNPAGVVAKEIEDAYRAWLAEQEAAQQRWQEGWADIKAAQQSQNTEEA